MNKKITAIIVVACIAIFTFFLGGAFLIYNSFITGKSKDRAGKNKTRNVKDSK